MKKPPPPASKPAPPAERDQGEDHEVDFAELMRRVGVKPLAPLASRTPSATTTRAAPAAKPAPTTPTLGQTPQPLASAPSRSTPRESERLASISARCDALITERDSASRERDALIEERDALIEERDALIKERDAAREVALARQRSLEEARALHLREAPVRAPPREDLAAQLRGRGLVAGEEARALALLAEGDALGPLLAQLEARDADAFAALLRRRIALVCDDPACAPAVGAAALSVARARCEVCGGSDIQRSASAFARACEGAGITRVRFVGGSPSYRSKLEELFSRRGHGGGGVAGRAGHAGRSAGPSEPISIAAARR
jgi:hypothetical protein